VSSANLNTTERSQMMAFKEKMARTIMFKRPSSVENLRRVCLRFIMILVSLLQAELIILSQIDFWHKPNVNGDAKDLVSVAKLGAAQENVGRAKRKSVQLSAACGDVESAEEFVQVLVWLFALDDGR